MEEEKFLIDSNIIIYYLDDKIPQSQIKKVENIFENSFNISTVSNIEVLGWHEILEEIESRQNIFCQMPM